MPACLIVCLLVYSCVRSFFCLIVRSFVCFSPQAQKGENEPLHGKKLSWRRRQKQGFGPQEAHDALEGAGRQACTGRLGVAAAQRRQHKPLRLKEVVGCARLVLCHGMAPLLVCQCNLVVRVRVAVVAHRGVLHNGT